jgi:autotransporter-associated beta strand protein
MNGVNTYSGGTDITGTNGIVIASTNNAALGTGTVTFAGGRRLVVNDGRSITNNIVIGTNSGEAGRGLLENSSTGTGTSNGTVTINNSPAGGGHFAGVSTGALSQVGSITSSVTIVHRLNTVIYSGGGSYTNMSVNNGTVKLGANNGLATNATIDLAVTSASNLDLAGFTQSLVGITKNASTATVGNSSTATDSTLTITGTPTWAGVAQDVIGAGNKKVNIVIASSGTVLFSGVNTYTGTTSVSTGSFGTQGAGETNGSAITVSSGATLLGEGNISGNITFNNGAICSPEISAADGYTLNGNVVFNATSIWDFTLDLPNLGIPGTGNDGIDDVDDLTLDGVINVTDAGGFGAGTYVLVLYSGALTNNTLTVGTLPVGFSAIVDTGTAGEVRLLVSDTNASANLKGNLEGNLIGGFQ